MDVLNKSARQRYHKKGRPEGESERPCGATTPRIRLVSRVLPVELFKHRHARTHHHGSGVVRHGTHHRARSDSLPPRPASRTGRTGTRKWMRCSAQKSDGTSCSVCVSPQEALSRGCLRRAFTPFSPEHFFACHASSSFPCMLCASTATTTRWKLRTNFPKKRRGLRVCYACGYPSCRAALGRYFQWITATCGLLAYDSLEASSCERIANSTPRHNQSIIRNALTLTYIKPDDALRTASFS
jgi:hypothetical protein